MDPIKLNKLFQSIGKSREIQRNIIQELSLEQPGFRDNAEKLGAPIAEVEDKNTNMKTDKLHKNYISLSIELKRLDKYLSNALGLQVSNQAHSSQGILPQNDSNFIANVFSCGGAVGLTSAW